MGLDRLVGQPIASAILARSLAEDRTSHAYLFSGPDGTGKSICAVEFARALVGARDETSPGTKDGTSHPDVIVVEPSGLSIKIEQTRRVQRELGLRPTAGPRRVCIIKRADKMTHEAANSLLKILEDPPATAVLILVTANAHLILPTVVSRCQVVPFRPAPAGDVQAFLVSQGIEAPEAYAAAGLSGGIIGRALDLVRREGPGKARATAIEVISKVGRDDPFSLVAQITRDREDRADVAEVLAFVAWMFRDAMALYSGSRETFVLNHDVIDAIRALAEVGRDRLLMCTGEIMRANQRIDRNCNIAGTLELLFMKLNRMLRQAYSGAGVRHASGG